MDYWNNTSAGGPMLVHLKNILVLLSFSATVFAANSEKQLLPIPLPYKPLVDSCVKACLINADCGIGGECIDKTCSHKKQFCANDRWAVNERGEMTDCGAYVCDSKVGLCRREASDSEHCSSGYAYDQNKSCTMSVQCDPKTDPGCQSLLDKWTKTRDQWEALFPAPVFTPFSCIACTQHTDCKANEMCWSNRCVPDNKYCGQSAEVPAPKPPATPRLVDASFIRKGLLQTCQEYTCEKVSGECLNSCIQNSDCGMGTSCDLKDNRCK
jgi:hypothetical protein